MSATGKTSIFEAINPAPRNDLERVTHDTISATWSQLGGGKLLGIKMYTAQEEAQLRIPGFEGDPSRMNPKWIGTGPVTAMVTVAGSIEPGQTYTSLRTNLQAAVPTITVELVPWHMPVPEGHVLAH